MRTARSRRERRRNGINRPRPERAAKYGRRGAVYPPSYARKRGEITRYALKTPIYAVCIEKFFGMCYNASVNERAETTAEHPLSQGAKCAFTYRSLALPTASGKGADAEQMRLPLSERARADSTDLTAAEQITDRTASRRASYIPFIAWRCDSSPGLRIAFFCRPPLRSGAICRRAPERSVPLRQRARRSPKERYAARIF